MQKVGLFLSHFCRKKKVRIIVMSNYYSSIFEKVEMYLWN
ncbi:hypothetical protein FB479_103523 [Brevibacillus sp. AG162]|nr:hypothetical protein FB479_103523 [Brevibacillus sp. AG162]